MTARVIRLLTAVVTLSVMFSFPAFSAECAVTEASWTVDDTGSVNAIWNASPEAPCILWVLYTRSYGSSEKTLATEFVSGLQHEIDLTHLIEKHGEGYYRFCIQPMTACSSEDFKGSPVLQVDRSIIIRIKEINNDERVFEVKE